MRPSSNPLLFSNVTHSPPLSNEPSNIRRTLRHLVGLKVIWCRFTIATKRRYMCKPRLIGLPWYSRPSSERKLIAFSARCSCRHVWFISIWLQHFQCYSRNLWMRGGNPPSKTLPKFCILTVTLRSRSGTFPAYETPKTSDMLPSLYSLAISHIPRLHQLPSLTSNYSETIFIITSNAPKLTCILGCGTESQNSRRYWIGQRLRRHLWNAKRLGPTFLYF